jgi:uncharacterized protein YndB with AHSA1/START domain
MRVEESIEIDKPVEEVFDYLFEIENFPEWSAPAIDVRKDPAGTPKEGDTFTVVVTFLGRRLELPYEVTDYDPEICSEVVDWRFPEARGVPSP